MSDGTIIDTYFDISSTVSMNQASIIPVAKIDSISSLRVGNEGTSIIFILQSVSYLTTGDILRVIIPSQFTLVSS